MDICLLFPAVFMGERLRVRSQWIGKIFVEFSAGSKFVDWAARNVYKLSEKRTEIKSEKRYSHHPEPLSPIQTLRGNLCAYLSIFRTCEASRFVRKQYHKIQCNVMQYNAIQHSTTKHRIQSNPIQCNPMQSNAIQCNAIQCNAMQCNTIRYISMGYWPSVRSRWLDIGQVLFLRRRSRGP